MNRKIWIPVLVMLLAGLAVGTTALLADEDRKIERKVVVIRGDGEGAYLGIMMGRDDEAEGVKVMSVMDGSPAEEAGLETGDLIVAIGGDDVGDTGDVADAVGDAEPGDKVRITVMRGGDRLNLTATLAQRPESGLRFEDGFGENFNFEFEFDEDQFAPLVERFGEDYAERWEEYAEELQERFADKDWHGIMEERLVLPFGRPRLGVELVRVTAELRKHLGGDAGSGVLVGKVIEDSPAEAAGVEVGDLIVSAGGETIADTGDLLKAIHEAGGDVLDLEVIRDGRTLRLTADIPEQSDDEIHILPRMHRSSLPVPPAPPAPPAPLEHLRRTMI
jgi:C-terminal processing protease CtpA/Prc